MINSYLRKFNIASKEFAAPDLTITGEVVYGTDYTLVNDTFTINTEKPITISGSTTSENVVVAKHVLANITLNSVSIDVSATSRKTAFEIETNSSGNVTVTLVGDNTLKSGEDRAGIGGGEGGFGSNITISGCTVTATGGIGSAGIGGGYQGVAKNIVIENATVTAKGAAGIGGGVMGKCENVEIYGSSVIAEGKTGAPSSVQNREMEDEGINIRNKNSILP